MTPDRAIDRLCDSIRESFAPGIELEFTTGLGGTADSVDFINVIAVVSDLDYDKAELVKLIQAADFEPCGKAHGFKGRIGGYKYRVMLCPDE
jgi:hypothetical protein